MPTSNTGAPGPPEFLDYSIGLQAAFQVLPRAATSSMDIVARWAGHGYGYHYFNRFAVVSKWFQFHVDPTEKKCGVMCPLSHWQVTSGLQHLTTIYNPHIDQKNSMAHVSIGLHRTATFQAPVWSPREPTRDVQKSEVRGRGTVG